MVKRALSIFKPTAKDSILAPAVPVPQSSLSGSWEIDSYRPNGFVIGYLLYSQRTPLLAKTPATLLMIPDSSATKAEMRCFSSPSSRGSG